MNAEIGAENDRDIGVVVTDSAGVEHRIEMHKDSGEIYAHGQDGYPDDPNERTPEESERVHQARKFAQYYVHIKQGYDTVPPSIHPGRIEVVRQALGDLSESAFREHFDDLYRQLASHHRDDIDRPVPIPEDSAYDDLLHYRKDIYLGLDPISTQFEDRARDLAATYDLDLSFLGDREVPALASPDVADWEAFGEDVADTARHDEDGLDEMIRIEFVSDLYVAYYDYHGTEHVQNAPGPDREPDALIEQPPIDPGTIEEFRAYLDHNLRCQVRDCFLRMGLVPPEEYRVLGFGRVEAAQQYETLDMYFEYYDPEKAREFGGQK